MDKLVALALFVVCAGAAAFHGLLHVSHDGETWLIVGAVVAFFAAVSD